MQADGGGAALSMSRQGKEIKEKKFNVNLKKLKELLLGKLRLGEER